MTDFEILEMSGINLNEGTRIGVLAAMDLARKFGCITAKNLERDRCAKILNDRAKICAEAADQSDNERFKIAMLTLASDFNVIEQEILDGGKEG